MIFALSSFQIGQPAFAFSGKAYVTGYRDAHGDRAGDTGTNGKLNHEIFYALSDDRPQDLGFPINRESGYPIHRHFVTNDVE